MMAYPNYYNPYQQNYYTPPMQDQLAQLRQAQYQPQQMQQPVQQQQASPIQWVQGEEGAKAFLVAAGNTVLLMDSDGSSFYLKSADASGMPLPLRIFDYTERTSAPRTSSQAANATAVEYVTRQEFDQLVARLEAQVTPKRKSVKEDTQDGKSNL